MNENLNLINILKNCPKGTKLYSVIHGEVEFEKIKYNAEYPIVFKYQGKDCIYYSNTTTIDGKFNLNSDGECVLFPSKDQRDWSKFNTELKFIDGEIYYCSLFKNVDDSIYIHSKTTMCKTEYYVKLNLFDLTLHRNAIITTNEANIKELRKATEEEKQQLLNAIKRDGYNWDEEKKELVKIEPKFDINTLQPFNKVLVRNANKQMWKCDFYDSYVKELNTPFRTINNWYKQCIPYNDETMHLVSTNKMPPEKYIN